MGIARSTYYGRTNGHRSDDTALVEAMHAIKDEFEAYGWRRMQAALRHRGWIVNHKKIKRLMREHAMHPPRRRCGWRCWLNTARGSRSTVAPISWRPDAGCRS